LPAPNNAITYDGFFSVLSSNLTPSDQIVAEIGLSSFGGSSFLKINRANGFLSQFIWAAIGWSVPAGLGASYINQTRTMIIVGDGAFKLTCQEISTMVKEQRNIVIFVLNNNVYAVEQILLNPAPFKNPNANYEAANILQRWDYGSLLNGFSNNNPNAMYADVHTVSDFMSAMTSIRNNPNALWLVNINLSDRDFPVAWLPFVNK
jgi:indolepyruvate decarboxylase